MLQKTIRLTLMLTLWQASAALADVTFSGTPGGIPLVGNSEQATLVVSKGDAEVVSTVAACVRNDLKTLTGKTLQMASTLGTAKWAIVAGTLGQSTLVDEWVEQGKVDTTGVGHRWEAYALQIVHQPTPDCEGALVVMGGTPRGTAYGLFEISRRLGVSPWIWWADVTPAPMAEIYVSGDRTSPEQPDVKYRGLFINDEDWALLPWARKGIDRAINNIGPRTYEKVMELLLRLRANCLWPAKHGGSKAFWQVEENKALAVKWAIVMSSGDSMLRDNLWEWPRFSGLGQSDYSFAFNRDIVTDYWAKRAGEARGYEGIYDIGMRGSHDVALIGYEGQEAQLNGLRDIIDTQRQIITDSLGGDPTQVPQIYIPYKEALTLYNAGLKIPDDVTLCWVDDNYGYIRQLPSKAEQRRSGGNGIYYHLSYLGNPCSYIWLSTISPSLCSYELYKGWENGMKTFWMVNVGDIKPAEVEFEFCMELAWDVERWKPQEAWKFSRWWAEKTFGEDLADELAQVRLEHYRLASQSKPETIREVTFSIPEMEQRIKDYQALEAQVEALESRIPDRLKDAYFELFTYPIVATANQNYKLLGSNLSFWHASMGHYDESMSYAALSRGGFDRIVRLTDHYNTQTANGKWDGMMNMSPNASATGSQFGMPFVATPEEVNETRGETPVYQMNTISGGAYTASRGNWITIPGLGVSDSSVTVWPIDYTVYTSTNARMRAPYAEYQVPMKKGNYQIVVRCLPTFPITPDNDLQVGLAFNAGSVTIKSVKRSAETNRWSDDVMHGYSEARFQYNNIKERTVNVRVYALNPALVVSQLCYRQTDDEDLDLTEELLVNPDFEQYLSGGSILTNTEGKIQRGVPYGWTLEGNMTGNSYGISGDQSINYKDGGSVCWFKAKPMPADFKLYQTIPAEKLQPGVYEVGCMLWNETGRRGSCRLFANDHVQYYAHKNDYDRILREDEISSFAGYKAGYETHTIMHPMRIVLQVKEGEDLTLGIKTSNVSNDGPQTDETGWFKVDHFTVRRLGDLPAPSNADSLTQALLANPDFELKADGTAANGSMETGQVPYGWSVDYTGNYSLNTSGLYGKAPGVHGTNHCAFTPSSFYPMPNDFSLFQTIPAEKLQPGTYRVSCLFWSENGREGQGRLFANDQVAYYGTPDTYRQNLTAGENATFGSYNLTQRVDLNALQELSVVVHVQEGEDLSLGVRSGSIKGDGTQASNTDRTGRFRVDHFRIELLDAADASSITLPQVQPGIDRSETVYSLTGQAVARGAAAIRRLPAGIYVMKGRKFIKR